MQEPFSKSVEEGAASGETGEVRGPSTHDPDSAEMCLRLGGKLLSEKNHADACIAFKRAIELGAQDAGTYYSLGRALGGCGKETEAAAAYETALSMRPDYPEALNDLGNILESRGKLPEALACFECAVRLEPGFVVAVNNLGLVHMRLGHLAEAAVLFRRVLVLRANLPQTYNNLGRVLCLQNALEEGIGCFRQALTLRPDYLEACVNLGIALAASGKRDEAAKAYRRALSLDQDHPGAWNNLGVLLKEQGKLAEAGSCFERALRLKEHFTAAMNNLGVVRFREGKLAEAGALYRKVLALEPNSPEALSNLGQILRLQGELEESIACYRQALALKPDFADALINLGSTLNDAGLLSEAISVLERAMTLKNDCPDLHQNLGLVLLSAGRLKEGWREFEWRWQCAALAPVQPRFAQPRWRGETGENRVLLLYAEQGFGDTIQFCRYAPLAAARGLRVVLAVQRELVRLMKSLAGVERIACMDERLPAFDFHCPLLSLPLVFDTRLETIPADTPYLAPEKDAVVEWKERLQGGGAGSLKVGLVCEGRSRIFSPVHAAMDRRRSVAPEMLMSLRSVPGVQFYSLQKDVSLASSGLESIDLMDECRDFADTAALMASLDLVISVDTAVAHLAGAMGKPVWVLNRFDSCWRWLQGREDSPWYPTMRLFRQPRPGDWESVLSRVREELERFAACRSRSGHVGNLTVRLMEKD